MNKFLKYAAAATISGVLALAAVTPSQARNGWNAAAIGFGVGAVAGIAAANAYDYGYYGSGYAYAPGYAYGPDYGYDAYAYAPDYDVGVDAYAYAPVTRPAYGYGYLNGGSRWTREHSTNNFAISSQR